MSEDRKKMLMKKFRELDQTSPTSWSNQDLSDALEHLWEQMRDSTNAAIVYTPRINVILAESNGRLLKETSKKTFSFSLLALAVAFVSLTFALLDFYGDQQWQNKQLASLEVTNQKLIGIGQKSDDRNLILNNIKDETKKLSSTITQLQRDNKKKFPKPHIPSNSK